MRSANAILGLAGLLGAEPCRALIEAAERQGLAPWPPGAAEPALARVVLPEQDLAPARAALAAALGPGTGRAVLERFDPGQRRLPGPGGAAEKEITAILFLNDVPAGGEVVLYPAGGPRTFAPAAGAGVAFPGYMTYEELPVQRGVKYVLRVGLVPG